ncbi:hypothetical protein [Streptomyces sp. NBC_01465]|uniref:hypothetical protein n=1 Tax=Streptomyces sp. NBC_01465 TaxID=2903878 RepID=UPI002E31BFC9|nr:hypothetical protein [Streptomyces sp. NBC_01465]
MTALPPVTAEVAAAALDLLPARLRKRVDGAVAKAAGWPVEVTPDGVVVRAAEDTAVTLKVTGTGVVMHADDAVCSCLLAPACLHRAAVLSRAPLAEAASEPPASEPPEPAAVDEEQGPGRIPDQDPSADWPAAAARSLWEAGVAVLAAGVAGSGAVHRSRLLHASHSARLAGLHRPSATAVRVARRLGEARGDDPAFRLGELVADLAELLESTRLPNRTALTPARRSYTPAGPLRLYGLFTEPVVTASGYAGATTYALAPDGSLRTISDIAPGAADRAAQAANSRVPGGAALSLRELGDGGGLILTSPTVSADGRIGGGSEVRSVRAQGAQWHEAPLDTLWEQPPAAQLDAPSGLLFLAGTLTTDGTFAADGGPTLRLAAPDERLELPYAENLRLLTARPGLTLRIIGRVRSEHPGSIAVLAAVWPGPDGVPVRADLGLRRLNRTHLPPLAPVTAVPHPSPAELPVALDLLRRTVDRTVAGGRPVAAWAAADGDLPHRLRAAGLTTGADCARALADAAADRRHDALGRLLPGDPDAFARAWLAASVYARTATRSLLTASYRS